jgi:diguanylate cyclase (GGDEF)-like protein
MRNRSEQVFKYRMVGLQSAWIESQNGLVVFYLLPPGNYTFEAKVSNSSLDASSATVSFKVRILPPWWRSNWFYALCGLAFLLALWVLGWLRNRHLLEKSRRLEGLVSERTRELEASREQWRLQATHDGLTGMLNRVAILRALAAEMDRARREERTVVVALIDLDHFKNVNDTHGHQVGDEALRWFAAAVGAAIRPYDHAGRYGGEEFLLVLTEVPRELAKQRLAILLASISNLQIRALGSSFTLTCSIGAALFDPSDPSVAFESTEGLLAIADQALYEAKAKGRNQVVFHSSKAIRAVAKRKPPVASLRPSDRETDSNPDFTPSKKLQP